MTLEEFLQQDKVRNSYIKYGNFKVYVHKGSVNINGVRKNVITRANTSNKKRLKNIEFNKNYKSTGEYRKLDNYMQEIARKYGYDGVYVEQVQNGFLGEVLERYGYKVINNPIDSKGLKCYYKPVNEVTSKDKKAGLVHYITENMLRKLYHRDHGNRDPKEIMREVLKEQEKRFNKTEACLIMLAADTF